MKRRVVVVGGGIVGSTIAAELTVRGAGSVLLLEQGPEGTLIGSSGHAPGYIGIFNESQLLTDLALATVRKSKFVVHDGAKAFAQVGNLELAKTNHGLNKLLQRAEAAKSRGIDAFPMEVKELRRKAPDLVSEEMCAGGVWYPADGTARADILTSYFRTLALAGGGDVVSSTRVVGIETKPDRAVAVRTAVGETIPADDIVLACGIWGACLGKEIGLSVPVFPVAHPYVYGPSRVAAQPGQPFVRWPERHVYARDHGGRLGIGSYDHAGIGVPVEDLGFSAEKPWIDGEFDRVIGGAIALLPPASRFEPELKLNGLFSMTPDNLPLVGATSIAGLWLAEAIWVTHSGGCAEFIVDLMAGQQRRESDVRLLSPRRFEASDYEKLREQAIRLYNDIYSAQKKAPD